jgi:hypothetical protein
VTYSLTLSFAGFALVSAIACSSTDPGSNGVTTIPMRDAQERSASVVEADRLAARACECEDSSCAAAASNAFDEFRRELDAEEHAELAGIAQQIRNCEALVVADAR